MALFIVLATLVISLFLVVKSSDYLVQFAAKIAKRFGVSEFTIGLTLVAIGTSLPELTNMIVSSVKQSNDLALGNILGSNMSDMGLCIGLSALVGTIHVLPKLYEKENLLMFGSTVLFYLAAADGYIVSIEGLLLLVAFGGYLLHLTNLGKELRYLVHPGELAHFIYHLSNVVALPSAIKNGVKNGYKAIISKWEKELFLDIAGIAASGVVLVYGANILVNNATNLAAMLGIANASVGATMIALGTTVPEMSISVASIRKGYVTLMIGNLIGSNITNILLIAGLGAIISPIQLTEHLVSYALPFLVAATALFSLTLTRKGPMQTWMGFIFLAMHATFILMLWFM